MDLIDQIFGIALIGWLANGTIWGARIYKHRRKKLPAARWAILLLCLSVVFTVMTLLRLVWHYEPFANYGVAIFWLMSSVALLVTSRFVPEE